MLLTLRMAVAAAILAVPFVLFATGASVASRVRLAGARLVIAANLILYFVSIRYAGVPSHFLSYMAPVYLAVVAPLFLKEHTERIVWIALGISWWHARIVLPGPFPAAASPSRSVGRTVAVRYAGCLLLRKKLRPVVTSATIVLSEATLLP